MTSASIPTAKGAQAPFAVRRNSPGVLPGFGISMGYAVLYLSVLVLIPLAALPIKSASLGWQGFWDAVTAPRVLASYQLTFGASLLAALVNLVFGTIVAWVLVRYRFPGKKILDALVDLPFALPTAVAGIALTALYAEKGWLGAPLANWFGLKVAFTPLGIVIALIFIGVPFVVRTVQPVLEDFDAEAEEASAGLGATRLQTFLHVILPSLYPALITGFALSFARAVGEYGSVVFISANKPYKTEIAPILIVARLEEFAYGQATAIAVVLLVISFTMLIAINMLESWSRRRVG
jgi:sulfate transport system permease protein